MSKQWGSGYYKGIEKAFEDNQDKWISTGQQIEECKVEWTREVLKSYLIKKRNRYICICPFHQENTPSCIFDSFEDEFYCLSCGKEGNGFDLASKIIKLPKK